MTDNVNHPAHYKFGNGVEVIDLTEQMSFNLGNVIKYVARAGRKTADPVEDLRKARFYLERELNRIGGNPVENVREWKLLDNVPPNTIVVDKDGDHYRRIQGTSRFQLRYWRGYDGEYSDWVDVPPWIFKDQDLLGPFKEVST